MGFHVHFFVGDFESKFTTWSQFIRISIMELVLEIIFVVRMHILIIFIHVSANISMKFVIYCVGRMIFDIKAGEIAKFHGMLSSETRFSDNTLQNRDNSS